MNDFIKRLSSRKFLLTLASIIFYILGGVLGKFPIEMVIDGIKTIVTIYVGVEGGADIISRLKEK